MGKIIIFFNLFITVFPIRLCDVIPLRTLTCMFPLPRYCGGAEVSHRNHQKNGEGVRCGHPL